MLVKSKIFSRTYFSPTYRKSFTNIHLNFCSKCSPTYRKFFTNILHQHTFNFLFKFFTNIQFFSPTYRKLFANILHQHTYKFLSSPTYSFTNIQKILHQHTFFHQHISPTSLQSQFTLVIDNCLLHPSNGKHACRISFQSLDSIVRMDKISLK